jgi:outer membrane protein OmpA-like peptidoglycan-associated protein
LRNEIAKAAMIRALILVGVAAATAAASQEMYPGQSVTVNPAAAGTRVLLYPGGQYVRVLPPLAQPGGNDLAPIHLHMPVHHRVARVHHEPKVAADTTATTDMTAAPDTPPPPADTTPTPAPKSKHHKTGVASAQPPEAAADTSSSDTSSSAIPFSLGGNAPPPPAKKEKPVKVAKAEPPPAQTPPPSAEPAKSPEAGFTKHGEIVFPHDATDPAPAQYDGLKLLATDLSTALQSGATRIQLQAYGGAPGDKGSDARRLSLKRALAIRQVLIDNGVPSGKIDVRAMGGADDHGNADRVDVLVRSS